MYHADTKGGFGEYCTTILGNTRVIDMTDYIVRNDLIEYLDYIQRPKIPVTEGFKYITIADAIRVVKERPTADVAPVIHGKWIYHKQNINEYRECSNCNIWFKWEMPRNSYCPNCGTKMDLGEVGGL